MFPSGSFLVFHVTFRSMTHYELFFVKGVSSETKFIFFWHVDIQLSQHHSWKRLSLPHRIAFAPLSKSFDSCYKSTLLLFSFLKGSQNTTIERSLEKGMATHSSILAWRIPWTEEPGRPQSIGPQELRVAEIQLSD